MNIKEQNSIDRVYSLLSEIREVNQKFREDITTQIATINTKVEEKHLPLSLEGEVIKAVYSSIEKSFNDALSGYNSPLQKYAINVVSKYQSSIEDVFDEVVKEAIKTDEFKQRVREVLLHKIAKTMISGIDGSIDKTINQMKQDAIFRSRLTLSVNTLVDEFLSKK